MLNILTQFFSRFHEVFLIYHNYNTSVDTFINFNQGMAHSKHNSATCPGLDTW